jgi:hypothetical protein
MKVAFVFKAFLKIWKLKIDWFFLFGGDSFDVGTMNNQNGIKSSLQRCPESLLVDLRKSFVILDHFVTCSVQFAAKNQIVKRVGKQMLNEKDRFVFGFADVLPIIIFSSLSKNNPLRVQLKF